MNAFPLHVSILAQPVRAGRLPEAQRLCRADGSFNPRPAREGRAAGIGNIINTRSIGVSILAQPVRAGRHDMSKTHVDAVMFQSSPSP